MGAPTTYCTISLLSTLSIYRNSLLPTPSIDRRKHSLFSLQRTESLYDGEGDPLLTLILNKRSFYFLYRRRFSYILHVYSIDNCRSSISSRRSGGNMSGIDCTYGVADTSGQRHRHRHHGRLPGTCQSSL